MTHAKGLRESLPNSLFAFLSPLSSQLDEVLLNHQARSHMKEDLERYAWWAAEAKKTGKSPTLHDNVPKALLPKHQNVHDDSPMVFADRFKVQLADKPSGTVTSHISKDGHYYIHYDPAQARSFSVREAARIQTFPDDYFFMGNRTQQYHQVGNAVPPYLAYQIGIRIAGALGLLAR
jgi:DNA (cytosine-5)-methyltransferase 1